MLNLYTIAAVRPFADTLVAGLMARRPDPMALARGIVLLPNNRGRRAVNDAFVRACGGGLLLPRLLVIGDAALDEAAGGALDPVDDADPLPPAVPPLLRRMILARLVSETRARAGELVGADEAVRLAGELGRVLDQLLVEEVDPARLGALDLAPDLSQHWQRALALFTMVLARWPGELAGIGYIDAAARRALMLRRLAWRWRAAPPAWVCVAGITDPAPAVAALLRSIAELADGMVVFPDLAIDMPDAEWDALGPHRPDPDTGRRRRSIETHPQFQLKLLLDRMGAGRGEVSAWPGPPPERAVQTRARTRARAIGNALKPAEFTGSWPTLKPDERRLDGVRAAVLATPADEAQAIAITLRGQLEQPGRTAALVTPDRMLAERVAAHCRRWGIAVDDSAGRPLAILPPGALLLLVAEAAAQDFAPLPLLALLKHPLVHTGEGWTAWLEQVRALDLALRGPRPAPGLAGIGAHLAGGFTRAASDWARISAPLARLGEQVAHGPQPLATLVAAIRETAQTLCGDALWAGPAGRAAAELLGDLEEAAPAGPALVDPAALPALLRLLMTETAVRPPQGGHPRLAIYGLIEARLQHADLMILGGLNEGVWPGASAPDPWLAPRVRAELGLPGLERGIGIAAYDFASGLGAPDVLLTRARRDGRSPTLASRFWLRLEALAGDRFARDEAVADWAVALDAPGSHEPAARPAPMPSVARRPKALSVTEVDRLKADPFAFYARRLLRLRAIDPVDAEPSPAWRGTQVHDVLQRWFEEDGCAPDRLRARTDALLADRRTHPLVRALWGPRLIEAIDWVGGKVGAMQGDGRQVIAVEERGELRLAGVTLSGKFDRIDRDSAGLVIVDYKTGQPPSTAAVREGFSLQLGLLGLIAERGGFAALEGRATGFEYWSLAKKNGELGFVDSPCDPKKRDPIAVAEFTAMAERNFVDAARRWLTGEEPFTAKLRPDYATFAEYDQLMRRDEWYGRG